MDKAEQRANEIAEKFDIIGANDKEWLYAQVAIIRAEAQADIIDSIIKKPANININVKNRV